MKTQLGRHVYGLAAVLFGTVILYARHSSLWPQILPLGHIPHLEVLLNLVGAIELFAGIALQWRKTARAGAVALGAIFLLFSLLCIPLIFAHPAVYNSYGNFFEQFSQFSGALILYASLGANAPERPSGAARLGCLFFGICGISLALEQLFDLSGTVSLVPKWIPPGQMFWAIVTTIAFALAGIALLSGRLALLASRLLAAMLIGFGFLVWLPLLFAGPYTLTNWTETAETFVIAGAAWIVADFLCQTSRASTAP